MKTNNWLGIGDWNSVGIVQWQSLSWLQITPSIWQLIQSSDWGDMAERGSLLAGNSFTLVSLVAPGTIVVGMSFLSNPVESLSTVSPGSLGAGVGLSGNGVQSLPTIGNGTITEGSALTMGVTGWNPTPTISPGEISQIPIPLLYGQNVTTEASVTEGTISIGVGLTTSGVQSNSSVTPSNLALGINLISSGVQAIASVTSGEIFQIPIPTLEGQSVIAEASIGTGAIAQITVITSGNPLGLISTITPGQITEIPGSGTISGRSVTTIAFVGTRGTIVRGVGLSGNLVQSGALVSRGRIGTSGTLRGNPVAGTAIASGTIGGLAEVPIVPGNNEGICPTP